MRIIARRALKKFWEDPRYKDSEESLKAWYREAYTASWRTPQDIKNQYRNASILKGCVVVFNVSGNKYRLVVKVNYDIQIVYIKFIGTHKEYDLIHMEDL